MNKRWLLTLTIVLGAYVQSAWAQQNQNPELPRDLHGLWWQPADPGWAIAMFDHPSAMSSALLIYDNEGMPTWLVSPTLDCYRDMPPWVIDHCGGALYRVMGPWFGAPTFRAAEVVVNEVGEWTGPFAYPLVGGVGPNLQRTLYPLYTIDGVTFVGSGMKPMMVQAIDPSAPSLVYDGRYAGLWGNPDESGWSIGIFVQNNSLYATLLVHGPDRQPRWYVVIANASAYDPRPDRIFEGDVFETRGYPRGLGRAGSSQVRQVGRASLHFGAGPSDPASLSYSIDGVQVSKTIVQPDFLTR